MRLGRASLPMPMLFDIPVLVVVPAFNESLRIEQVLRTMPTFVDHVILVDDASTDGTREVAHCASDPRVTVLRNAENHGVGKAITNGYKFAASVELNPRAAVIVMAGDAQMHPDDMPSLVRPIAAGDADYVKGNRFVWPGVTSIMPFPRWAAGHVLSWLTSLAVGKTVHDSQCGYTAIAREAIVKLPLHKLWPRYGYPNDLLGMASAHGLRIAERPVRPVYAGEASGLRAHHVAVIFGLLGRIVWRRLVSRFHGLAVLERERPLHNRGNMPKHVVDIEQRSERGAIDA